MIDVLNALWGPLGGVLAALGAVATAWLAGRRSERTRRQAQDAKEYQDERKKIDDEVSGIGGTDAERIERLRDIARRRGERPN